MLAHKLKTFDDLLAAWEDNERQELINGEIVQRPSPRFSHSTVQGQLRGEYHSLQKKKKGDGGWWICTEISVRYSATQAPSHDIAGWRKERLPQPPAGVMTVNPDWVCEIVSPSHEKKDTLQIMLLLLAQQVPYYWIVYPEDRTVMVYALNDGKYVLTATETVRDESYTVALPPFMDMPIDLGSVFEGIPNDE